MHARGDYTSKARSSSVIIRNLNLSLATSLLRLTSSLEILLWQQANWGGGGVFRRWRQRGRRAEVLVRVLKVGIR